MYAAGHECATVKEKRHHSFVTLCVPELGPYGGRAMASWGCQGFILIDVCNCQLGAPGGFLGAGCAGADILMYTHLITCIYNHRQICVIT